MTAYMLCHMEPESPEHEPASTCLLQIACNDRLHVTLHRDDEAEAHRIGLRTVLCRVEDDGHVIAAGPLVPPPGELTVSFVFDYAHDASVPRMVWE